MDANIISVLISVASSVAISFIVVLLKFAKYQERVDTLKENVSELGKKNELLRSDVDGLKEFKINAQKFIDQKLYTANSPLQLSPFGQKIVQESGFCEIFEKTKEGLVKKLQEKAPKTQYDVQEQARELMDSLGDYSEFQSIKPYAFKNGIDFLQILRAGSILLRDYYLSKHPEITS